MSIHLKILSGKHYGKELPVNRDELVIGRSQGCDIRPNCDRISRRHCKIQRVENYLLIEDLKSANGTQVNGNNISSVTELANLDEFQVGSLKMQVIYQTPSEDSILDNLFTDDPALPEVLSNSNDISHVTESPSKNKSEPAGNNLVIDWFAEFADDDKEEEDGSTRQANKSDLDDLDLGL